jgi:hypothetical protein
MCWMQSLKGNSLISLNCNATMDWCCGTAIDGCCYVVGQWVKHHPRGNVVLARPEDFTARISQLGFGMWNCCLHDSVVWPWGMSYFWRFYSRWYLLLSFKQAKKKKNDSWFENQLQVCVTSPLKTPASFLEVDAFELDLNPPPRCARLQGGCEPTCSNCRLKLFLKH